MDNIQIFIFVLTLLYFVVSALRKKNKTEEDFEWEGDGVLDDIIQKDNSQEGDDWQPWMTEQQPEQEPVIQEPQVAVYEAKEQPLEKPEVQGYDEFSSGVANEEVEMENTDVSVLSKGFSPAQGLDFSKETSFNNEETKEESLFDEKDSGTASIFSESFLSRYSTKQLLVLIPAIMERKEKDLF